VSVVGIDAKTTFPVAMGLYFDIICNNLDVSVAKLFEFGHV
jgi:hypothetical protein